MSELLMSRKQLLFSLPAALPLLEPVQQAVVVNQDVYVPVSTFCDIRGQPPLLSLAGRCLQFEPQETSACPPGKENLLTVRRRRRL